MLARAAVLSALCSMPIAAQALELTCKGTMYLYTGPVRQGSGHVSVEIDEEKGTLTLRGLINGSGTGKLDAQPERMQTSISLEHVIEGVTYPYVFVNIDRYSGEALVLALTQPQVGEPAKGLFSGTCTRQSRLF